MDTGAKGTVVSESWWKIYRGGPLKPCGCMLITISGPQSGLQSVPVHVVLLASPKYDVILGCVALLEVQAEVALRDGVWKIVLSGRRVALTPRSRARGRCRTVAVLSSETHEDHVGEFKREAWRMSSIKKRTG